MRPNYTISAELMKRIIDELNSHWFSCDEEGESYNNSETIELTKELEVVLGKQEEEYDLLIIKQAK